LHGGLGRTQEEFVTLDSSATRRDASHSPAVAAGTIALGGDLVVNRMGFGAMRITGPGIMGPPADRGEAIRVLRRAVELGVNFIDTADSYGPYISEELIAEALHPYPDGLVIATKGGLERPGPDIWTPNGHAAHLRRALEGSLRRLKVERIDLWQLHRIDPEVSEDEQFGVLAEFVREGKVRHIGLSEVDVDEINRARRVVSVASVQNRYNVLDRKWESVISCCERHRMAFIPWFPLGAGGLHSDIDDQRAHERIEQVARRHEATPLQVALAWLLDHSHAMLVIPGTSSVRHLEEDVAAAELELDDDDIRILNSIHHR
jgi:aryl-alcohol dehydrogenase-like predicted oxidoreductase